MYFIYFANRFFRLCPQKGRSTGTHSNALNALAAGSEAVWVCCCGCVIGWGRFFRFMVCSCKRLSSRPNRIWFMRCASRSKDDALVLSDESAFCRVGLGQRYHAPRRWFAWDEMLTRRTLEMASGLAADTARDIRLGHSWGFPDNKPTLVAPCKRWHQQRMRASDCWKIQWLLATFATDGNLVINPRGFRLGLGAMTPFSAAFRSLCVNSPVLYSSVVQCRDNPEAEAWLDELQIRRNTVLLPTVPQDSLWGLFHVADVSVSVSEHDGTPNSLLEAMTPSVVSWLRAILNRFGSGSSLCNRHSGGSEWPWTACIRDYQCADESAAEKDAAEMNRKIIQERAGIWTGKTKIELFYNRCLEIPRD